MPEIYPLEWSNERLKILDQTKLPKEQAVIIASNYVDVLDSIKSMSIKGLSIISVAAGYALTLAAKSVSTNDVQKFLGYIENITNEITTYKIIYNSTPDRFIQEISKNGLKLNTSFKIWRIQ